MEQQSMFVLNIYVIAMNDEEYERYELYSTVGSIVAVSEEANFMVKEVVDGFNKDYPDTEESAKVNKLFGTLAIGTRDEIVASRIEFYKDITLTALKEGYISCSNAQDTIESALELEGYEVASGYKRAIEEYTNK